MITVTFNITTDASGDYDSDADGGVTGQVRAHLPLLLYAVDWVDGDLADGVDAVLSTIDTPKGVDTTLLTLTNANNDARYYPRALQDDSSGADTTFYTPPVVDGQLKLVVSSGGNAKTGKCFVYLFEV